MLKISRYLYLFCFGISHFIIQNIFTFPAVPALCFLAKQSIDRGLFLVKTEQKKIAEKKKIMKLKKIKDHTESSDDDFI